MVHHGDQKLKLKNYYSRQHFETVIIDMALKIFRLQKGNFQKNNFKFVPDTVAVIRASKIFWLLQSEKKKKRYFRK